MKLTVVIPCRNEVNYIEECIDALYKCQLPSKIRMNIFIVDGMSDDGTRDTVKALIQKYPTLELVDNKQRLTPFAFNLGIHAGGKADYVQIVGARHILSENYLQNSIDKLKKDQETWCVGGKIINEYTSSTSEIIAQAMSTTFGMGIGNFRTLDSSGYTDTVTSPMYRYSVFEKIGFFDEELTRNQDDDFNYRVSKEGGKIYYDNDISLKYYVRGTFKGLWRQFFQYGYWKVYVNKKHKAVTTIRQLAPPLLVLYVFSLIFTVFFSGLVAFILHIPLISYLSLNIFFSIKASKSIMEFPQLFLTYLILHFGYGLGYLKGVFEFILFGRKPAAKQKRLSR